MYRLPRAARVCLVFPIAALFCLVWPPQAISAEIVVRNDSLGDGATGAIQSGFVAGESAAVWLTSPCDGNIVAIQVFWRSVLGGEPQSIEDSISIFAPSNFPFPGQLLELLEAPVLTDGALNEYRYLDENQTVPISVPVVRDQVFVVSFKFFNDPEPVVGASVVTDTNGCQAGKNAINAIGLGWVNACSLGVSGDFVIRAVIDCQEQQGACCLPTGCQIKTASQCAAMGGSYRGNNTNCNSPGICDGACCFSDGSCTQTTQSNCTNQGGTFGGVLTPCSASLCRGACCLPDGTCANSQTPSQCASVGGAYKGNGTNCAGVTCNGACCANGGACTNKTQSQCDASGGVWNGPSTSCASFSCPVSGACCLPDGSCQDGQTAAQCQAQGGVYKGDNTTCASNPCVGACCFAGSCLNLSKSDCTQISGAVWQGPAYQCGAGNSCPSGACCLPLGDCIASSTPASCAAQNGVFHSGQSCAQANCPVPIGACCFNNGTSCIGGLTPQQCALISGSQWKGVNSQCGSSCCPPPKGDMNGDLVLNGADVQRFVKALLGSPVGQDVCKGDFNSNGILDTGDVPGFVGVLLSLP